MISGKYANYKKLISDSTVFGPSEPFGITSETDAIIEVVSDDAVRIQVEGIVDTEAKPYVWQPISIVNCNGFELLPHIVAPGLYAVSVGGLGKIRVNLISASSPVTVSIRAI